MELRQIPLMEVLRSLGVSTEFKERKGGTEYYGKCPFHSAQKNATSFSFDADGRFHCFSCGVKGRGSIDLVMAYNSVNYQTAVEYLKQLQPQVPASRPVAPRIELTENPPYKGSYDKFKVESEWLRRRGISVDILEKYGVFEYNNPNRKSLYSGKIMLPIRRLDGVLVGYLARHPNPQDDEPKYVFPKGVLKSLEVFGAHLLKDSKLKYAYLVESPFAVLKFAQLGFPAVSCYGWSVSEQQVSILAEMAKGWIFLPDKDKRSEALHQVCPLLSQHCWVKAPEFPADDPEHLTAEQIKALT